MEIKLSEMCDWERKKAVYLMSIAEGLGLEWADSYGEVALNTSSGYVYLWCEDYPFTLYMPINCELKKRDVMVMWTDSYNGNEYETALKNKNLEDLYKWCESLEKQFSRDDDNLSPYGEVE